MCQLAIRGLVQYMARISGVVGNNSSFQIVKEFLSSDGANLGQISVFVPLAIQRNMLNRN